MAERVVVGGPRFEEPDSLWFEAEDPATRSRKLFDAVRAIEHRQTSISDGHVRHAEIFASYQPSGLSWSGPTGPVRAPVRATRNIIRSVCETATALISKTWPRPRIVTDGGDWDVQRRAQQLDKFLVGVYRRAKVYQTAQICFRDSTIFGTGAFVIREAGTGADYHLRTERVLISDLIVDEQDCADGTYCPSAYYIRRCMPKRKAIRLYARGDKEKEAAILAAAGSQPLAWPGQRHVPAGYVVVVEAWHVDDIDGKGSYVVAVEGTELVHQDWPHPWAPIVVLYWSPPVSGFYGDGVAYRQYGRQKRVNYLYQWVQRCQDLIAVPRVWVDSVNGPLKVQISNEIGEIVGYRGPRPEFQTPQAVGPEVYNWLDRLEAGGFEDEGISQATSSNMLPPGIESAPAQRELSFKEGTRFAPVSQRWEEAVAKETAQKSLALYKERFRTSDGETPRVTWSNKKLLEQIDWDDVDLETEQYEIRVEASSLEDLSPAGRIQAAIELAQTGWIEPAEGRRLLGHPDLDRSDEKGNAASSHAEWVSANLKNGRYIPPNRYGDLELQQDTVKADLLNAEMGGADEDAKGRRAMALMRQFLRDVDSIMNPPAPEPVAAPGQDPLAAVDPSLVADPTGLPTGVDAAPAPALSLPAAQGLGALVGTGTSRQNF